MTDPKPPQGPASDRHSVRDDSGRDEAVDAEDKGAILARRAAFVAAALAAMGVASCTTNPSGPIPALEPPPPHASDASVPQPATTSIPAPCLSPRPMPPPDEPDAGGPAPMPCLSMPAPMPCLKPVAPKPPKPAPMPCLSVAPVTPSDD